MLCGVYDTEEAWLLRIINKRIQITTQNTYSKKTFSKNYTKTTALEWSVASKLLGALGSPKWSA